MIFETKTIHAAIFDMDGTMFDTERLRMNMLKIASEQIFGESINDKILIDSLGLSARSAEELAKREYGSDYPYRAIRKKADELEVDYVRANGVPIKKGLFDVLERLKKNGLLLAVATSSKRSIAEEYLLNSDIISYFDIIVCGDEVLNGKPHPEIFLKAIEELNCDPSRCLIFEDSENGVLAASRSGAIPIFIKDMKEPRPEIKALALKSYGNMLDFLDGLVNFTNKMPVPNVNESFPKRLNHIKVGIHGFGAIGGGYLTQVFSYWDGYTRPAEIIGAARSSVIREIINSFGRFNIHYDNLAIDQIIDRVRIIDMKDENEMKKMYAESELISLCLPESAIKTQADIIAKGLVERNKRGDSELTILVVLNRINGGKYVKQHVKNALLKLVCDEKADEILSNTRFCESVVNRIVSKVPLEMQLKQVQLGLKSLQDNIDRVNVSGVIPKKKSGSTRNVLSISKSLRSFSQVAQDMWNINITLFHSGAFMTLYVGKGSAILERLRQVKVLDDIRQMQELKNKLSNGAHAIAAWYSSLLGYSTIGQGMGDERVRSLIENLMKNEIRPAMLKIIPESSDYIDNFIITFIKRCRSSFNDPCTRVGRDPLRKLQRNERIFGTIDLAHSHNIETPLLEFGVAVSLLYAISCGNQKDKDCQLIRELYNDGKSIRNVLLYNGIYNAKPYRCLDAQKDADLIERIEKNFDLLKKEFPIEQNC